MMADVDIMFDTKRGERAGRAGASHIRLSLSAVCRCFPGGETVRDLSALRQGRQLPKKPCRGGCTLLAGSWRIV